MGTCLKLSNLLQIKTFGGADLGWLLWQCYFLIWSWLLDPAKASEDHRRGADDRNQRWSVGENGAGAAVCELRKNYFNTYCSLNKLAVKPFGNLSLQFDPSCRLRWCVLLKCLAPERLGSAILRLLLTSGSILVLLPDCLICVEFLCEVKLPKPVFAGFCGPRVVSRWTSREILQKNK